MKHANWHHSDMMYQYLGIVIIETIGWTNTPSTVSKHMEMPVIFIIIDWCLLFSEMTMQMFYLWDTSFIQNQIHKSIPEMYLCRMWRLFWYFNIQMTWETCTRDSVCWMSKIWFLSHMKCQTTLNCCVRKACSWDMIIFFRTFARGKQLIPWFHDSN